MNLGFVGLGAMGQLIVPRLLAAGHAVTGWNRSSDKAAPLIEAGMRWAPTPRSAMPSPSKLTTWIIPASSVLTGLCPYSWSTPPNAV